MLNRLKFEMRHKQLYYKNDHNQPVVVQCNPDGTAEYMPGLVPSFAWQDFTTDVEGLDGFRATWQAATTSGSGEAVQVGSNYSKAVSLELRFINKAFDFIYNWLMITPCQALNAIDCLITDLDCGKRFRVFEIKLDNTIYRPTLEPCIITMSLRERDDVYHAFETTIIEDDWQKWFNQDGTSTKQHPAFIYIVEKKPKFFLTILVVLAYIAGILSVGILIATTDGKRWIRKLLGICYFGVAPFIRTYIENICGKYGYTFDTIFDDKPGNPYRDLCHFYPVEKFVQEFDDFTANTQIYNYENRTGQAFNNFLDRLKIVFNAEWYVTPNNQLVFKHKSFFDNQTPIADFTNGSITLTELEYSFNGNKKPAYGDYQYQLDPADLCTNDIKWRYNTIVDYSRGAINPMMEGHITKPIDFSVTAFNKDGTEEKYLESAIKTGRLIALGAVVVGLGQILAGTGGFTVFIAIGLVSLGYAITNGFINNFIDAPELDGAVRLSNNQCNVERLLLYDRNTPLNQAKVVSVENPIANPEYNLNNTTYYFDHPTANGDPLFGTEILKVYNYPMYIDERFKDNLFDRFHEYDNPLKNTEINQEWTGKTELCCETMEAFGVFEDNAAKIGAVVILENRNGRLIKGRITYIEPDYKSGYILLKGRVLK